MKPIPPTAAEALRTLRRKISFRARKCGDKIDELKGFAMVFQRGWYAGLNEAASVITSMLRKIEELS